MPARARTSGGSAAAIFSRESSPFSGVIAPMTPQTTVSAGQPSSVRQSRGDTSDVSPRDWRTELGWPADTVVCGVIGAMTPEKGLDSLEKIAAALPPDVRARAGIVPVSYTHLTLPTN